MIPFVFVVLQLLCSDFDIKIGSKIGPKGAWVRVFKCLNFILRGIILGSEEASEE